MLGLLLLSADFFQNDPFQKLFQEQCYSVNGLDPDQDRHSVGISPGLEVINFSSFSDSK